MAATAQHLRKCGNCCISFLFLRIKSWLSDPATQLGSNMRRRGGRWALRALRAPGAGSQKHRHKHQGKNWTVNNGLAAFCYFSFSLSSIFYWQVQEFQFYAQIIKEEIFCYLFIALFTVLSNLLRNRINLRRWKQENQGKYKIVFGFFLFYQISK